MNNLISDYYLIFFIYSYSCLHDAVNSVLHPFDQNLIGEQFDERFLPTVDIFLHLICEFPPYISDLLYIRDWVSF